MALIEKENDKLVLKQDVFAKICQFELEMKQLKAKQDDLRKRIKDEMEAKGIKSISNDVFNIMFFEENDAIKLDSKMLKEKYPDIVDKCSKISHTNSFIKITFNK